MKAILSENLRSEGFHKAEVSTLKGWERRVKDLIWEDWNAAKKKAQQSNLMIGKVEK